MKPHCKNCKRVCEIEDGYVTECDAELTTAQAELAEDCDWNESKMPKICGAWESNESLEVLIPGSKRFVS